MPRWSEAVKLPSKNVMIAWAFCGVIGLICGTVVYKMGYADAIQEYRKACNHRQSMPPEELEFEILHADVRPSNCEEGIRLIWGEAAMKPVLGVEQP